MTFSNPRLSFTNSQLSKLYHSLHYTTPNFKNHHISFASVPCHYNPLSRYYSTGKPGQFKVTSTRDKTRKTESAASASASSSSTASPSTRIETNSVFSITNLVSNFFANYFRKNRHDKSNLVQHDDERRDPLESSRSTSDGMVSPTKAEPPYMNPELDSYQLLRTPMTDLIQTSLVDKSRKIVLERLAAAHNAENTVKVSPDSSTTGKEKSPNEEASSSDTAASTSAKKDQSALDKFIRNTLLSEKSQRELERIDEKQHSELFDVRTIQDRNFLLNTLGYYNIDHSDLNHRSEILFDKLIEHVAKFSEANLYDKTNLPNPGDYWVESELNLLNLHMWFLFRRLSFCYDGRDMMNILSSMYWRFITITLEKDVGVPGPQVNKSLKKIQDHAYAMWFSLDEVLQVDAPAQDVLFAEIVMKYMYPIVEDVRMRDLYFWTRYIRFTQTHLDMVETPLFIRGEFEFEMPHSNLVTKVDSHYAQEQKKKR